ncbi:MAG: bifunctional diguanylate cyclase/phosphodiesterase [Eubacteriales bacterium]|nr:bifunctional diguanylate cyclase/phosphodiesterase [Eubacteriales bacterium]
MSGLQFSVSALKIANSHQQNHIALLQDITQRKEMEQALRYNNDHDRWTGLYNRSFLERLLAEDADRTLHEKRAVVGINLVEIQSLTSRYGFQYTQKLIKKIVAALLDHCSGTRSLFCTYENRFVFYIKNYTDKQDLIRFSQEIAATLKEHLAPERIGGGISIVEINQDNAYAVEQLLKDLLIASEYAMRDAEHELGVCYYDDQLAANFARRQDIEDELIRVAASKADDGLYLHYQPVLDLKTGRICAFEALTRLHSDMLGNLSPAEFIPIAEEAKLILPIGRKIVSQALCFLKRLHESGFESVSVLINISIIQLIDHEFSRNLFQVIRDVRVNLESIGLEITESVFAADFDRINRILGVLDRAGLHVSIDDFGTGYSSFSREQDLNIKSLKIDKSFVDGIMQTDPDKTVIADIIAMAHKFDHITIAEGVEHEKQLRYLKACGCDWIQGYLVSRPLDENAALDFLARFETR